MGRLAVRLALPAHRLFLHHRYARPIHLHIQDRNRFPHHDRQIQLHGALNLPLLALSDVASDGLRGALHRLGGHLQAGQDFHLLAAMIEGGLLTHDRLHAAHPRRELRVFDVQFDIGGELAGMTVRAQVVGARYFHFPHRRQNRLGAQLPVVSLVAAGTRKAPLVGNRSWKLQEFGQRRCSGLMHGRANRHFDGFQIQTARPAATIEDHAQQLVYFARDFLADRFGRFFSCAVRVSSTGRKRQTLRLTSTNSLVRERNLRNSAISSSALWTAA